MRYPLSDSSNDIAFDYTADGVRRSIEDSLQRLGVDSLDVAFVHDIPPDFAYFPNGWEEQYEIGRKGAFPAPVEDARRGHHTGLGHRRESVLPPTCQKYLFSWWVSSYRSALSAYCSL